MNQELYTKIADALVDDGYIIIENALGSHLTTSLRQSLHNTTNFKAAGISGGSQLHRDTNRRRDKIAWLSSCEVAQKEFLDFSDGLREYLNRALYLGLSYYEAHFAVYEEGDFYEKHLDAFKNSKNRVVTTVYYLNESWRKEDGGELVIYDEDDKLLKSLLPKGDTLVVFLSEKFPHEVKPAKKQRLSIAGWFRVDKAF